MRKQTSITLILTLMAVVLSATIAVAQDYQVIVNSGNSMSSASKADLSKWFLKKSTKWSDSNKVKPVDFLGGKDEFCQTVHGKSSSAIKSFWQKQIFSGKGTPPPEKGSDAEVIAFVKANPGAIGYVSASTDVSGVKVITIN